MKSAASCRYRLNIKSTFAGGIAMVLGYFLSSALTARIRQLEKAARELERGNLEARVAVSGSDEMAGLARTFNQMAAQLHEAAACRFVA